MTDVPLISIGMPVFNGEAHIREAIESILWQTWKHWELIVMDDGSSDASAALARGFGDARIRVYSDGRRLGLARRMNEAVRHSRGAYFARMDADDIAFPERLESQMGYLHAHPHIDLVGAQALVFESSGRVIGTRRMPENHTEICASPCSGLRVMHPTFMACKSWFERFPYHEGLKKAQDQALLASSMLESRFANVPEVLLAYREDVPRLGKLLSSRWYLLRGMGGAYWQQGKLCRAAMTVLVQGLKMMADLVLSVPALRRRQLACRSSNVTADELANWDSLNLRLDAAVEKSDGQDG